MAAKVTRRVATRILLLAILGVILSVGLAPAYAQDLSTYVAQDNQILATNLLRQVNDWRVSEGRSPLSPNSVLEQMAIDQAAYIRYQMDRGITVSNFHVDANGLDPLHRAYQLYHWATYGAPERIEVGENAGVGTVSYAINYWQHSDIHRRAALSQTFREAGVAAIPTKGTDTIFIIVFGARPGVLPAQVSPDHQTLFLDREYSRYSTASTAADPQIRIFDENGIALTRTQTWSFSVPAPSTDSQLLYVLYTSGDSQWITRVDLLNDVAVLSNTGSISTTASTVAPSPTSTFTATLRPNVTPSPTLTPSRTPSPTRTLTPSPTYTPSQTLTPSPTFTPTVVPTEISDPDLIITYNANSLVIRAVTSRRPNISGLRLVNSIGNLTVARWVAIASFPADAFPQNQCLVAYRTGSSAPQSSECTFVRSIIQVVTERVFWTTTPFDVMNGDQLLATCQPSTSGGRCLVKVG